MSKDELLAALDLAPENLGPITLDDAGPEPTAPAGPPPSPTALQLDSWSLRRGAEALQGDILGQILAGPDQEAAEHAAADCLAAAFEPSPKLAENCANETQGRFFKQLLDTEDYQALHAQTQLDAVASELAAGHFAKGFVALAQQEQRQEQQPSQGQGNQSPQDQVRQQMKKDIAALGAVSQALLGASQDVNDYQEAQRSLGGDELGGNNRLSTADLKKRFDHIKKNHQLRRIMELAGRYRRLAQAKQRQKVLHGQDDVVGVELGNDLSRLCPAELGALGDEDLEADALRRYLERGMMQRDYRGLETKTRGPIVVVVDESGSMNGEPIATAKAFCLAMAWIAKHQNRWVGFVGFAAEGEINSLMLPPGKWDQDALIEWLEHFYSGGTHFQDPLKLIPKRWEEWGCPVGQTDMIFITDAKAEIPLTVVKKFRDFKAQAKAKVYTLVLGDEPGDVAPISDRVWCLDDLGLDQEAIQEAMAI